LTGQLGDVMKESVETAKSFIRSQAVNFGIKPTVFKNYDIHVHVPEGATPKDGPSAGVAMCTSIVSVLTGIPVKKEVAMTGEITLQGRVLPIGGLKEKLLAALRSGIKTVLIPDENQKDLKEIPDNVKKGLKIIAVKTADEVLKHALAGKMEPIKWDPEEYEKSMNITANKQSTNQPAVI
jgi:ATP-dependent Lon protease